MTLYVNNEKIEDQAIKAEAERLTPQYEQLVEKLDNDDSKKRLTEWSRENLIEQQLLRQAAARDIKTVDAAEVDSAYKQAVDYYGSQDEFLKQASLTEADIPNVRADIEQQIKIETLLKNIVSDVADPGDKQMRKYFEANSDKFAVPEMVTAAHIVKHPADGISPDQAQAELEAILTKIKAGESFEELAAENSDCPDSGGSLGSFGRGMMVQAFEDVVFNMEPGQVSDVFQTEFGFHIAKVTDKKPALPCKIADVKEVIVKDLRAELEQKAIEKFIDAEKETAVIEDK
ncbi:MAG: peptidylprolyl isomerase [Planctomycetes bacterium]|nr:peptidylprolyl isomerase [Planctomycetota bacterium]